MNRHCIRRLAALLIASVLCVCTVSAAGMPQQSGGEVRIERAADGEVSAAQPIAFPAMEKESEIDLYSLPNTSPVRVSIILNEQSAIDEAAKRGVPIDELSSDQAAKDYRSALEKRQKEVAEIISEKVLGGEPLDVVWNLTLVTNAISANVESDKIEAIKNLPEVEDVIIENTYGVMTDGQTETANPLMNSSCGQIGSNLAWADGLTGAGCRIAVVDTGTDYQHQSFNGDAYMYALKKTNPNIEELNLLDRDEIKEVFGSLNISKTNPSLNPDTLYFNPKIPFGYDYAARNTEIDHRDGQSSHGSHVAGIATANSYIKTGEDTYADAFETVGVRGAAPDAQLIAMKVFRNDRTSDSDYVAAIEDAIILKCDAINLSLGSPNSGFSQNSKFNKMLSSLTEKGVVLVIAAGNSYRWPYYSVNGQGLLYSDGVNMQTVGSPASYTESLAVASVDSGAVAGKYITAEGHKAYYTETLKPEYPNTAFSTLKNSDYEYIFLDNYAYVGGASTLEPYKELIKNKIVFCRRGGDSTSTFDKKAKAAVEAGAAATIICNDYNESLNMNLQYYEYKNPCVAITKADAEAIKKASKKHEHESGAYYTGRLTIGNTGEPETDLSRQHMSEFSSWGVPGSLELKPEITAPGGGINSVEGAESGGHTKYAINSGTSMASPQVAGLTALMAQYVREKNLTAVTNRPKRALIQSLLMSTAIPLKSSGDNYYPVILQGAGLANIVRAVSADSYIMMSPDSTRSWNDGKIKAELGDDPSRDGEYKVGFTIYNLTDESKSYNLSADLFTQALTADKRYMYTETEPLAHSEKWTIDGQSDNYDENLKKYDFDGDGRISKSDADHLMEHVVGGKTLPQGTTPDVSGDNAVTSYDVYCLLEKLDTLTGNLTVPPRGSREVSVTLSLTDRQKQSLNDDYPSGAYVQGFILVNGVSGGEGGEVTQHSIPMLAFYGDWTDPSMYEVGTILDDDYGERTPYVIKNGMTNHLVITYADTGESYAFAGNPVIPDEKYMEERNAIASKKGDKLKEWRYTAIRNVTDARASVLYPDGKRNWGTSADKFSPFPCAYYLPTYRSWQNGLNVLNLQFVNLTANEVKDDMQMKFTMTLVPEYTVGENGKVDWANLKTGKGTTRTVPFTIDNQDPKLDANSARYDKEKNTLTLTAYDNQYVAGVFLYDESGETELAKVGASRDESLKRGDLSAFTLNLPDNTVGNRFKARVYDYARNLSTYTISINIIPDSAELPTAIAFDNSKENWVGFDKSNASADKISSFARSAHDFRAATMVDGYIFAVDSNKMLCIMPQENPSKATIIDIAPTEVIDMAYDKNADIVYALAADGQTIYTVDKQNGAFKEFGRVKGIIANTLACSSGTLCCTARTESSAESRYVYSLDNSLEAAKLTEVSAPADVTMTGLQALEYDRASGKLFWLSYGTDAEGGEYGYLFSVEPTANGNSSIIGNLSSEANPHRLSCLVLTETRTDAAWAEPVDRIDGIEIIPSVPKIAVGGRVQLTAIVQPWNTRNPNVKWQCWAERIASVTDEGVVTGLKVGNATITAASAENSDILGSVTVSVTDESGIIQGILRKPDGSGGNYNALFTYQAGAEKEVAEGKEIEQYPTAVSLDSKNNALYVLDMANRMNKIDPSSGKTLDGPYEEALPMDDFQCSTVYSFDDGTPYIYGVSGKTLYYGKDPRNINSTGTTIPISSSGYSDFIAIASMGRTKYDTSDGLIETEKILCLDKAGKIWDFYYSKAYNRAYIGVNGAIRTLNLPLSGASSASMFYAQDGYLYVSLPGWDYMTYARNTKIYRLSISGSIATATALGAIDGAIRAPIYGISYDFSTLSVDERDTEYAYIPLYASAAEAPQDGDAAADIKAKDKSGADVGSHNGKITISYDAQSFALKSVSSNAEVFSYNDKTPGIIVLGYADLENFPAGETVARLTFERKNDAADISVTHNELNDTNSGYVEYMLGGAGAPLYELRAKRSGNTVTGATVKVGNSGKLPERITLIAAVCRGDMITAIKSVTLNTSAAASGSMLDIDGISLNIPSGSTLKLFVWSGTNRLAPLCTAGE